MTRFAKRRDKLRSQLRKKSVDALLVTNFTNVSYLTGFSGEDSYLLITPKHGILLSDERFTTQLEEECPDLEFEIRGPGKKMLSSVSKVVSSLQVKSLGFESNSMTVALHRALQNALATSLPSCELVAASGLIEALRMIKDRNEIERTRAACELARRAFEVVRATLTPEMTELQVAADLEYQARRFGGKCMSFPSIVAVGPRSALPHANPTSQQLGADDFLLIDWGVNEGQYMSDLTRILVTGKISPKLRKIYEIVLKSQLAAIKAIKPGVACAAVDRVARTIIAKAGYGKQFGHGLGHGTGLEIHEAPRLAHHNGAKGNGAKGNGAKGNRANRKLAKGRKTAGGSTESPDPTALLQAGMIVTVEPGIYLPGWGGVRIEDDILVTRTGHEVLTSVPKQLDECLVG